MNDTTHPAPTTNKTARLARRLSVWAFIFFAAKGLLWLVVPALLAWASV